MLVDGIVPRIERSRVITFALVLGILLAPWPGWGRIVAAGFTDYANAIAHTLGIGDAAQQRFSTASPVNPSDSADEWIVKVRSGTPRSVSIDTRILAYTPIAVLLALAAATPMPRRRKLVALALGMAAMLIRLSLVFVLPAWTVAQLYFLVVINPSAMSYFAPLIAWWISLAVTRARV
jgi:hypothetical protein